MSSDLYGLVSSGAVADGPRTLPTSWPTADAEILAFDRYAEPEAFGWWPWIDEPAPPFDPATERLEPALALDEAGRRIVRSYRVVALTADERAEADPVPPSISDRQFAQALAKQGMITKDEALAFVKRGEVPARLQEIIDAIADPEKRFDVDMLLSGATLFERSNPSTVSLVAAMDWTPEQADDLWRFAATLR